MHQWKYSAAAEAGADANLSKPGKSDEAKA